MKSLVELAAHIATETREFVGDSVGQLRSEMVALIEEVRNAQKDPPQGPKGDPGEKGEPGARGEKGDKGEAGKDAEPLDTVALAKDVLALIPVPRDGRDGIATTDELTKLVDAKVAEVLGPVVTKAVADAIAAIPLVTYKGVWTEQEYAAGNMVTWAGQVWHCREATTEKPGDGSKFWTLAVRKGRDGRDSNR